MRAAEFAKLIKRSRKSSGGGYTGCCPAHDDTTESLSFTDEDDRLLVHCFAGCSGEKIVSALGLTMADLFNGARRRGKVLPLRLDHGRGLPKPAPLTVAQLAAAKQLPETFLREIGVRTRPRASSSSIGFPMVP
jgi:hypothetical protein